MSRRAGTALRMNLADRFFRVAKANLNNLLQNFEDPEKVGSTVTFVLRGVATVSVRLPAAFAGCFQRVL